MDQLCNRKSIVIIAQNTVSLITTIIYSPKYLRYCNILVHMDPFRVQTSVKG